MVFKEDLMRELHSFTWYLHDQAIRTTRGSRPGSPIAASLFHLAAMSPIVQELDEWMASRPVCTANLSSGAGRNYMGK